ncbi:phenylacetate--CoA ligase family protein [Usitatibacter palustris]|uniref:Phenylacetate-coenzyme A ligase n=1 Tax=Usitatibacter palustris TaxID=2732487 RepID=A0A6M4H5N6_9PROT|nr:AMP-binding protein [Usitatibacter palustris]QJR14979.1 Phenylacetate-coenzyme A ligase [Usitatibacter palustris]
MAGLNAHYDELETRAPEVRERELFARLPAQIAHAKAHAPYFTRLLAGIDPASVTNRPALARLPVTRKSALVELQKAEPPFGGLNATAVGGLARIFMSPGPIYDPEGRGADYWRTARTLFASGFRAGDLVIDCFSYHLSPAASMFETGLHKLGCSVIPGGTGQSELQCRAITDLRPVGYVGTPSFLKILVEKADELKLDFSSIRRAIVSGEAFLPPVREFLRSRGIDAYQAYGTADLGMIAYETSARQGMTCDEELIVEIVRPGTGDPVAEGEVGEVVVTSFSPDYPLVRFATGDLSALLAGVSPCGRTNLRIKGWMGRADQTTKVRGLFVHPHQVAEVLKRHGLARARLTVENEGGEDRMTLSIEGVAGAADDIAASIKEVTKLRGDVKFVASGSLPNDGKVIEDLRKYD